MNQFDEKEQQLYAFLKQKRLRIVHHRKRKRKLQRRGEYIIYSRYVDAYIWQPIQSRRMGEINLYDYNGY